MITLQLKFFARYRETLCVSEETLQVDEYCRVIKLMEMLAQRGNKWSEVFSQNGKLLVAVNHELVSVDTRLNDGDEVAFYPPVSGG